MSIIIMANINIPFLLWQEQPPNLDPARSKLLNFYEMSLKEEEGIQNARPDFQESKTQSLKSATNYTALLENLGDQRGASNEEVDVRKNLLLVPSLSGEIYIMTQEFVESSQNLQVQLIPKVVLVPSLTESPGRLVDSLLLLSPAPHIIQSSSCLLLTLHEDQRLRLWSMDDGRCLCASSRDLLTTKPLQLLALGKQPGFVVVVGAGGDFTVVNAYTMRMHSQTMHEFQGCFRAQQQNQFISLCDEKGAVFVWENQSDIPPQKSTQTSFQKHLLLGAQEEAKFQFEMEQVLPPVEEVSQLVYYSHASIGLQLLVHSKGVESIVNFQRRLMFRAACAPIFASYFEHLDVEYLAVVDADLELLLFKVADLRKKERVERPHLQVSLLAPENRLFRPLDSQQNEQLHSLLEEDWRAHFRAALSTHRQLLHFKHSPKDHLLLAQLFNGDKDLVVTFSLSQWLKTGAPLLLTYSNLQLRKQKQNCIHFSALFQVGLEEKYAYDFFYKDETLTSKVAYLNCDSPSLVVGTSHGRVFVLPMFHDLSEQRPVAPILALDSHKGFPITHLFLSYNYQRLKLFKNPNPGDQQRQHLEQGAQLIAVSKDGTLSITNLYSPEIQKILQRHAPKRKDLMKIEAALSEVQKNRREKRRQSIQLDFTTQHYFNLARIKPYSIYNNLCPSGVSQIVQVQDLTVLNRKIDRLLQEETLVQAKQHADREGAKIAVLCTDGSTQVLKITQTQTEVQKLMFSVKQPIGFYANPIQNKYYVLTEDLSLAVFSSRNGRLERLCDFETAYKVLRIEDLLGFLQSNQDSLARAVRQEFTYSSFDQFEQAFGSEQTSGFESNRVLDFLLLSLTNPINYHPRSFLQRSLMHISTQTFLQAGVEVKTLAKKSEGRRQALKALNKALFQGSALYRSDFGEEFFTNKSGVSCVHTGAGVFNGEQQTLVLTSSKSLMNVLATKTPTGSLQDPAFQRSAEESKVPIAQRRTPAGSTDGSHRSSSQRGGRPRPSMGANFLKERKWPAAVLSLMHPFTLDDYVDQKLEEFCGLMTPILDFRIGVQGIGESFSFIIDKTDEDFHIDQSQQAKLFRLMQLAQLKALEQQITSRKQRGVSQFTSARAKKQQPGSLAGKPDPEAEHQFVSRTQFLEAKFVHSDYWKQSRYLSSIIPSFFMSTLLSVVHHDEELVTHIMQEWLHLIQNVTRHNSPNSPSLGVLAALILDDNHDITSTARDALLTPLLHSMTQEQVREQALEWLELMKQTYHELKKIQQLRNKQLQSAQEGEEPVEASETHVKLKKPLQYFGDLEVRCLVAIAYVADHHKPLVSEDLIRRVSKVVTFLTREIVAQFSDKSNASKYIHFLTTLLQILLFERCLLSQVKNEASVLADLVRTLLIIHSYYSSPTAEKIYLKHIHTENFSLTRPLQPELYLKMTALKSLLHIGVASVKLFLDLIRQHATTLEHGNEYQLNVLDILKTFIKYHGEILEQHLIQVVQILLKCFDQNDVQLRKNSHKMVSSILKQMVHLFPMISFHAESQRLAVGTFEGHIAIYDARTAAMWKILEGHTGNVTTLRFNSNGSMLISYSAVDLTVRLWKIGNAGFFNSIMGSAGKCSKCIMLAPLPNTPNPHFAARAKEKESPYQLSEPKPVNSTYINFNQPKEKTVDLKRENNVRQVVNLQ